jgi:hypothetical protein
MTSTPAQRKRTYHRKRLAKVAERLASAQGLLENEELQLNHQPNAGEALRHVDRALVWTDELIWIHDKEKAELIALNKRTGT